MRGCLSCRAYLSTKRSWMATCTQHGLTWQLDPDAPFSGCLRTPFRGGVPGWLSLRQFVHAEE